MVGREEPVRPKVLAISGSPRRGGNTETLLDHAIAGARSAGAKVEKLVVVETNIHPCTSCGVCLETGQCPIEDEMAEIYPKLLTCNALIVASPVFFHGVPAQLKALIDRCQALWARKEQLGQKLRERQGRALLISVGGTDLYNTFQGIELTIRLIFKLLNLKPLPPVLIPGVDEKGEILKHPATLSMAKDGGKKVVS